MFGNQGGQAVARVGQVLSEYCFQPVCAACGELISTSAGVSLEGRSDEPVRFSELMAPARSAGVCSHCLRALLDELLPAAHAGPSAGPAAGDETYARCRRCSRTLISEHELCSGCRATEFAFVEAYALFEYRGLARKLLWLYKFENHKPLAQLFAALLYHARLRGRFPATVVPVPAQRRARARRGWDQLEVITRSLSRRYAVPVARALRRARGKASQKQLGREDRFAQAALQYHVASSRIRGGALPIGETIVLLDDVITTGATASACAELLIDAGAGGVEVLSLMIR